MKRKVTLEYQEDGSTLWARVGKKRYMICQASGELVAAEGHDIADLYWSDVVKGSPDFVRSILREAAKAYNEKEGKK